MLDYRAVVAAFVVVSICVGTAWWKHHRRREGFSFLRNRDSTTQERLQTPGEGRPLLGNNGKKEKTVSSPFRNLSRELEEAQDDEENAMNPSIPPVEPLQAPPSQKILRKTSSGGLKTVRLILPPESPDQFSGVAAYKAPAAPVKSIESTSTAETVPNSGSSPDKAVRLNGSQATVSSSSAAIDAVREAIGKTPNDSEPVEPVETAMSEIEGKSHDLPRETANVSETGKTSSQASVEPTEPKIPDEGSLPAPIAIRVTETSGTLTSPTHPSLTVSTADIPRSPSSALEPESGGPRRMSSTAMMQNKVAMLSATEPDDQMKAMADAFKAIRGGLGGANRIRRRFDKEPEFDSEHMIAQNASSSFLPQIPAEFVMVDLDGINCEMTKRHLKNSRVVRLVKLRKCTVRLSEDIGSLVKLFLEECVDTSVTVECKILTQHLEIVRCERLQLFLKVKTETVQVDLSKNVKIVCDKEVCPKVYHAGVQDLQICSEDTGTCTTHDFRFPGHLLLANLSPEQQYLTAIDGTELRTEPVKYATDSLIPEADHPDVNGGIGNCDV